MHDTTERWKILCKQASTEKDSQKLIELITEINDLLEQKRARPDDKTLDKSAT